jgi:hypothetical protein
MSSRHQMCRAIPASEPPPEANAATGLGPSIPRNHRDIAVKPAYHFRRML